MASGKEFWAPLEVALDILGFNKNILEKRIAANYIKKEVKDDLEILEISGEIERFGLSEKVAKEKLENFLNRDEGENVRSIFEEEEVSTDNVTEAISTDEIVPVESLEPESNNMNNPINIPDYSEQLNYIASMVDEVKKYSMVLPQILSQQESSQGGDETSLISNGFQTLTDEISRLGTLNEQNKNYEQQIKGLNNKLKTADADNIKLTTQCTQIMDEMDRNVELHKNDLVNLRNIMKTEFSEISNEIRNSSNKGGAGFFAIILLLLACGGVGFLISEFFVPRYTILKNQNQKMNPLSKDDVSKAVKVNIDDLESKLKEHINNINDQVKANNKKNVTSINSNINTSLELQESRNTKSFKLLKEQQKSFSELLEDTYLKELKKIDKEVKELKDLLKRTLETSVQIKPGSSRIINDSNE
ncbi:MAG: hypothetical protein COA79_06245 [Planctomycetota bacterium]|nr:MAG: hypothetical protein COA79_06245 [Planctomycetota bacterium]